MKDRGRTEQKILDAVGKIVKEKDFDALGINAIAEEAGVAKVLIYRYFGNFEGLLREWALGTHYWPTQVETGTPDFSSLSLLEVKKKAEEVFIGQLDSEEK
jgi:DNA-binding transcriptional regulator YbjK